MAANSKHKIINTLGTILTVLILVNFNFVSAQVPEDSEAIAFRVFPNPNYYSALRWYENQGFSGSPQSITVDGYRAVRDGRTVYVNAANVNSGTLYTNVYLISYNQEASQPTVDIFSQILSYWKFNTNISISGSCSDSISTGCYIDDDCPLGEYCSSDKARLIRDTRRLEDLADMKTYLSNYQGKQGRYPTLSAGTYLAGKTLSVWPSWQNVLAQELGRTLPVDPLNFLVGCSGLYHGTTCWSEVNKEFVDLNFIMPAGSRVYKYLSQNNGLNYYLCAIMESGFISASAGACTESDVYTVYDTAGNQPPTLVGSMPALVPGMEFIAFVRAVDPEGDALSWSMSTPGGWSGWSAPPVLQGTVDATQKRLWSATTGIVGSYTVNISVDDGNGGIASAVLTFNVEYPRNLPLIAPITDKNVIIGQNLSFTITATEADSQYPLSYNIAGGPGGFNSGGALNANGRDYDISGVVIDQTGSYLVTVSAVDTISDTSLPVSFNIVAANNPPIITSSPITSAEGCVNYSYQVVASDPDGHLLSYFMTGPTGLSIDPSSGLIDGRPVVAPGVYPVTVTVRDEYYNITTPGSNAQAIQSYNLNIVDEPFTVTPPVAYNFYVGTTSTVFIPVNGPTNFGGFFTTNTTSLVNWSYYTSPVSLLTGLNLYTNPATGRVDAYTYTENMPSSGYTFAITAIATTYVCRVSASNSVTVTVYPNQWIMCGNDILDLGEQCEEFSPGNCTPACDGTGPFNQWDCISCTWSGGWCGDATCNAYNESAGLCPGECLSTDSDFSYCTDLFIQDAPGGCYNGSPNPLLTWDIYSAPSEFCNCDGNPSGDCPYGIPCAAATQVAFIIQLDDDSDFSSPEVDTGIVYSTVANYRVTQPGLSPGGLYYWRLTILDSAGSWGGWAECTAPEWVWASC